MNDVVLLGKALADPTRVRILCALLEHDLCVCELSDAMEMSVSTLSTHLQVIRQAGIVDTTRRHRWISYTLSAQAKKDLGALLNSYSDALSVDHRLQRDRERIARRLALRQDGLCVHGAGSLSN